MNLNRTKLITLMCALSLSYGAAQASWYDTLKSGVKIVGATAAVATASYYAGKFSGMILKNRAESRFAQELAIIDSDSNVAELKKIIRVNHVVRDKNNEYRNFPLVEEKAHLDWYLFYLKPLRFLHTADYKTQMQALITRLGKVRTAIIGDSDFTTERRNFETKK
jgi:hypothetical protein